MASRGEKIVVLELLVTEIVVTVKELQQGRIPRPSQYIASLTLFAVVGGVSALGEEWSDMAAAFGAVVLLTTLLHPDSTRGVVNLFKIGADAKVIPFPKTAKGHNTETVQAQLPPGSNPNASLPSQWTAPIPGVSKSGTPSTQI